MLDVGTSIFLLSRRLLEVTRPGATTSPNPDFTLGVRLNLWSAHSLVVLWLALHVAECPLCGAIWLGGTGRELLLLGVRRNLVKDMVDDETIFDSFNRKPGRGISMGLTPLFASSDAGQCVRLVAWVTTRHTLGSSTRTAR